MFSAFRLSRLFVACLLLTWFCSAKALVLQVDSNGILTGATGVSVNGDLYNVVFGDGSCNGLFGGCSRQNFAFHSSSNADAADTALIDYVFVDTSKGNFASDPSLIDGCTASTCDVITPYDLDSQGNVLFSSAQVYASYSSGVNDGVARPTYDLTGNSSETYATWTSVPEPASLALLGLGLVGLGLFRRRNPGVSNA